MKKILSLTLAIIMLIGVLPLGVFTASAEVTSGTTGDCTWTLDGTVLTISGNGEMGDYDYNNFSQWGTEVTQVTIEKGVTGIGQRAFLGCENLVSVTIPDGVTSIGGGAFYNCSSLTSVTVPSGVTSIGSWAFEDCFSLISVTIPNSLTSIGDYAFSGCFVLNDVYFGGSEAQRNNIVIGAENTALNNATWHYCETHVYDDDCDAFCNICDTERTVEHIYDGDCFEECAICGATRTAPHVFENDRDSYCNECGYLREVEGVESGKTGDCIWLKDGIVLTVIGYGKMADYSSKNPPLWGTDITEVKIEYGVTSIGKYSFSGCTALEKISFPNSVTSVGEGAFYGCIAIDNVYFDGYRSTHLSMTVGTNNKPFNVANWHYNECPKHEFDDNCDIECNHCAFLRTPTHTYSDDRDTFCNDCYEFREITLDGITFGKTGACYWVLDGTVLTIGGNGAMGNFTKDTLAPWGKNVTEVIFEEGVTSIGNRSFYGCEKIERVSLATTIQYIGNNAFYRCKGLTELNLPEGLTSVGVYCFKYCTGLTEIRIPESLTDIGMGMFDCCDKAVTLYLPGTVKSIGDYAFTSNVSLKDVYFENDIEWNEAMTIGAGQLHLKDRTIWHYAGFSTGKTGECNWKKTGTSLFISGYGNTADYTLTTGTVAPWGTDVTDVTVKFGVTSIGNRAFAECQNLKTVSLPDSVTSIGNNAFLGCKSLEEISLPSALSTIGVYVFKQCSSLKEVSIPDGVVTIGSGMFDSCTSLNNLGLPSTVTNVSEYAFYNCTSLTEVWYQGTQNDKQNIVFGTGNGKLKNANWNFDGYGIGSTGKCVWIRKGTTLVISGNGAMQNYTKTDLAPWGQNLTNIIIEEGVTNIGNCSFYECKQLESVQIPSTVKQIGNNVFYGCSSLTNVTLPKDLESLGTYVFGSCSNLTEMVIPDKITKIDNGTFENCSSLSSITIPEGITSIGIYAFYKANALSTVNYKGTKSSKDSITIGSYNAPLGNANWVCSGGQVAPGGSLGGGSGDENVDEDQWSGWV